MTMGYSEYNTIWESFNTSKEPYMSLYMLQRSTGLSISIIRHTLEDKKYRNSFVMVIPGIYKLKSTPEVSPVELAKPLILILQHKQMSISGIASAAKKDETLVCAIIAKSLARKYFVKTKTLYSCSQEGLILLEQFKKGI